VCWALLAAAWADVTSQVIDIQLAPNGNLTFIISGTGFDPLLEVRPIPQERYQITIASREARLNGPRERSLAEQIQTRLPAIESIMLSGDETGFQLNLTSWQKLQPQILSNTPGKIVVTFLGKHQQRPPQNQVRPAPQSPPEAAARVKRPAQSQAPVQSEVPLQSQASVKPEAFVLSKSTVQSEVPVQSQATVKPDAPVSSPAKPMPMKEAQSKPAAISALFSPVPAVERPETKRAEPAAEPAKMATEPHQSSTTPKPATSGGSGVKPVRQAVDQARVQSVPAPVSPVKAASLPKRVAAPVRVASIAPKALQMDWLPVQPPSRLARLPKVAYSRPHYQGSKLEALNFLSQSESGTSATRTPKPPPLRLQKTPAGYDLPTALSEQPDTVSQPTDSLVLGNEYSVFLEPALQRAAEDLRNGRLDNAEVSLQGFLAREPHHPQANYLLALVYLSPSKPVGPKETDNSRQQQAQRLLETLQAQQPRLLVYQQLIGLAMTQNQSETATNLLKQALRQFPENAWLWYQQGRALEDSKHWEAAQSAYTQALALDGHHPEYLYRLALMHMRQENWPACSRALSQALDIVPDDARFLKLMGYLSEKQGVPLAAAHYYQAALQSDVMLYYGRLLQQQNRTAEALSLYQAVESVAENDPDLLLSLATLYTEAKASQRAQVVLKRLIQRVPDPKDPRHSQAKAMLWQARN
jgi:tetratricopeptide (TPR) repeat protein